jgi:hypothetical protein
VERRQRLFFIPSSCISRRIWNNVLNILFLESIWAGRGQYGCCLQPYLFTDPALATCPLSKRTAVQDKLVRHWGMTLSQIWRPIGQVAGCALLIQAGLLFAPAAVHASCGDYLTIHPSHADMSSIVENQHLPGPMSPAMPLNKPCSGPQCSQAPSAPSAPAPAPVAPQTTEERADVVLPAPLRPALELATLLVELHTSQPCRTSSDIFHPPR